MAMRFVLEEGLRDASGRRHREGSLRPATARDEMQSLADFRVFLRPESVLAVVLARTVTRLGDLSPIDVGVIDALGAADRAVLERLYRDLNGYPRRVETAP
jgi:hypothetical protein